MAKPPDKPPVVVHVHDRREEIEAVEERILRDLEDLGYPRASGFAVRLAFEEAITNAFEHGHRERPGEPVTVEYRADPARLCIAIQDRGPGFDPHRVPDPTLDENLDKPFGRGLMLIRSFMSSVSYNAAGNRVEMCYDRPAAGS